MQTISSEASLQNYIGRSIVSVYLDHAYSTESIDTILNARQGFDAHVGKTWHLLIPYIDRYGAGFAVDTSFSAERYNVNLARQMINRHKLTHEQLPAVSFEILGQTGDVENAFFLNLRGLEAGEIRHAIGEIADIIVEEAKNDYDDENFRVQVLNKIRTHLNRKRAANFAASIYKKVIDFSALASLAGPFFVKGGH